RGRRRVGGAHGAGEVRPGPTGAAAGCEGRAGGRGHGDAGVSVGPTGRSLSPADPTVVARPRAPSGRLPVRPTRAAHSDPGTPRGPRHQSRPVASLCAEPKVPFPSGASPRLGPMTRTTDPLADLL